MAYERKQIVGNAAQTTLTAGITDVATTLSITNATNWPDGGTGPFIIAIGLGTATEEKILCTERVGTTITVRVTTGRGHDATTPLAHSIGATVDHVLDAETVDQVNRYANLQTTKGDVVIHNGTNAIRVPTAAVDATTDAHVLQLSFGAASGWIVSRLISLVVDASAPAVAGTARFWHDTVSNIIRPSNGSSWLVPTQLATCANAAARNALFSSPLRGHGCWRTDLDFAEVYNGATWEPLGHATFADTAARDAYFDVPVNGDMAYITGAADLYLYRADEWILVSNKTTVAASQPATPQNGDVWFQPI